MPRPEPIWERWKKDPDKSQRIVYLYWAAVVMANLLVLIGIAVFMVLLLRPG